MKSSSLLENIKNNLAENYRDDEIVLNDLIDETVATALSLSNRNNNENNIKLLAPYIKECVIGTYLNRGGEGSKSLNDGGKSSSFEDNKEKMRKNIIKDGLRLLK